MASFKEYCMILLFSPFLWKFRGGGLYLSLNYYTSDMASFALDLHREEGLSNQEKV